MEKSPLMVPILVPVSLMLQQLCGCVFWGDWPSKGKPNETDDCFYHKVRECSRSQLALEKVVLAVQSTGIIQEL